MTGMSGPISATRDGQPQNDRAARQESSCIGTDARPAAGDRQLVA
jgi:hypothetical protein